MELFSSRTVAITGELKRLAEEYEAAGEYLAKLRGLVGHHLRMETPDYYATRAEGALTGRGVGSSARADNAAHAQAWAILALASAVAQLTRPTETDVT
jgi:hypothetical protein